MQVDSEPTDQQLVQQCHSGDRAALEFLVNRHQHGLFCFLLRLIDNIAIAEDLLQETMIGVAKSIVTFQGKAPFIAWAKGIAHRRFLDWLRAKYINREVALEPSMDDENPWENLVGPGESPDRILVQKEERELVHAAIAELGRDCQDIITAVDLGGMQYDEAAAALDLPEKTVSSRLFRCREKLQPKLERYFPERRADMKA